MDLFVEAEKNNYYAYYYYLFKISLGKHKLYNKQLEESKEIFNSVNEAKLRLSFNLVYIQHGIYSYWMKTSVGSSSYHNLSHLITLFKICLNNSTNQLYGCFIEESITYCLLLDLSLMIGRLFCQGKDARFARLYCSKQLETAQCLHLPIRTCELLILQAEIDLACANIKDLQYKLNGVEAILELSRSGAKYAFHASTCSCPGCSHVEYQIAVVYTMLAKIGLLRIQQSVTQCLELLKECRERTSNMKKKFNLNLVSGISECDLHFNMLAVEILADWGKYDKALKYKNHAMNLIERSFKTHDSELSTLSLGNMLRHMYPLPKIIVPIVTTLCAEPDHEFTSTPQMSSVEVNSPPPIGWKVHSPNPGKNFTQPDDTHHIKMRKLIFPCSPEVQTDKLALKEQNGRRINNKNTPTIVINSDDESHDNSSDTNSNVSALSDNYLQLPHNKDRFVGKRNKFITPTKSISVFCDGQENNETKTKSTRYKKKPINGTRSLVKKDNGDEGEGTSTRTCDNRTAKRTNRKEKCKPFEQEVHKPLSRKQLFDTDNIQTNSSDILITTLAKDDNDVIFCSSDDSSIVDATVIEDSIYPSKIQLVASNRTRDLENKMSSLCLTPTSPVAFPIPVTTVKKYPRKLKPNTESTSSVITDKFEQNLMEPTHTNSPSLKQLETTPNLRMTRSNRKLFATRNIDK